MQYKEIKSESLIKKITTKDKLFNGKYTIDPYQNCEFGCSYCDSYLDKTIYVKINAPEILEKDLKEQKKGRIIVGSVHDPYQNAEKKFCITKDILEIIKQNNFSCHILTKSDLILRDIYILSEIKNCFVTTSIISLNSSVLKIFEKNVISTKKRLRIIKKLSDNGVKTGLAIIPIIPFLVEDEFENIIKSAKKYKAQYIIYKSLELKGDQKNLFMNLIKNYKTELLDKYKNLYKDSYLPDKKYILQINKKLDKLCRIYNLKHIHN